MHIYVVSLCVAYDYPVNLYQVVVRYLVHSKNRDKRSNVLRKAIYVRYGGV